MNLQNSPGTMLLFAGLLGCAIMASGCAQVEDRILTVTAGKGSCTAAGSLPLNGSMLLLAEAQRELARMNSSGYSHRTSVDEEKGIYNYDCSGFVGYALNRVDPCAFTVLLHDRPDTGNFYYHILGFDTIPGSGGWMRVPFSRDLRPGDIIVWPRDASENGSSGHIMIVAETPQENPERAGELLVRVIDSTTSRHAGDTRGAGESGLGEGTVGIMTDSAGRAIGYFWRGGESRTLQETEMAFARIA